MFVLQPKFMVERLFIVFDVAGRGVITEQEFCCAAAVMLKGTHDSQLRLLYQVYDVRNTGYIERFPVSSISILSKHCTSRLSIIYQSTFGDVIKLVQYSCHVYCKRMIVSNTAQTCCYNTHY